VRPNGWVWSWVGPNGGYGLGSGQMVGYGLGSGQMVGYGLGSGQMVGYGLRSGQMGEIGKKLNGVAASSSSQTRQQLTMQDRMPPLLGWMRPHVSVAQWGIMSEVGLGGVQRYRVINRYHSLMVSLIERWDPTTNVFHLPTGEMTITLEDVYRTLRLLIDEEAVFQVDAKTAMDSILHVFGDAATLLMYHNASIAYGDMYRAHRHETRLAV
ncbi:hypothetical protein KI387_006083, partial [Taxus chinensis]